MAVSIQQAAINALATWLASQLSGVTVLGRWPSPDWDMPAKAVTIIAAGPRRDEPIDPQLIKYTDVSSTQTLARWQVAACYQPLQLDIWAKKWSDRDDLIAQLDPLLYSDARAFDSTRHDIGRGVLLKVQNGWEDMDTYADYTLENPDLDDTGSTVERSLFRASYRGGVNVMLALTRQTARQVTLKFSLLLKETDSQTSRNTIVVFEP